MKDKLIPVEVEWIDAQTGFGELQEIGEFKQKLEPFISLSCGYLLEDNKDYIILGFLLMDKKITEQTGVKYWQLIPRGMVKKITKLEEKKK